MSWKRRRGVRLGVRVGDLCLRDLFHRHRQVVLRPGLDQRRRCHVEADALAELVVIAVDLAGPLGGHDDERVARVDVLEQIIDARFDHEEAMVAANSSSCSTIAQSDPVARATSSFRTM